MSKVREMPLIGIGGASLVFDTIIAIHLFAAF